MENSENEKHEMKEVEEKKEEKKRARESRIKKFEEEEIKFKEETRRLQKSAKINLAIIWLVFFGLLTFICYSLSYALWYYLYFSSGASILIGVSLFFIVTLVTLILGYLKTPSGHNDISEVAGRYIGKPLGPGPHLVFPYLGLQSILVRVFTGTQKIELFLDEGDGHGGSIEFQDASAGLKATFFYKIVDSEKSIYAVEDLEASLKDRGDHLIRAFFGPYTIDEAIELKSFFNMENVASLIDASSDTPNQRLTAEEMRGVVVSEEEAENTEFYRLLKMWGVEPISFAISDLDLPDDLKDQRARMLTSKKDEEVAKVERDIAKIKKEIAVINAQAEARRISLEGSGEAKKVRSLIKETELSPENAAVYLADLKKWECLKDANVTLIEGSGSKTGDGVELGLGIGSILKK